MMQAMWHQHADIKGGGGGSTHLGSLHIPAQVIVQLIIVSRAQEGAVVVQLPACWLTQLCQACQVH